MINKKVPERMCMACRSKKPKKDLIRIVKNENDFNIDYSGKMNGRGAYICKTKQCIDKCIKQKCLHKTFKTNVSPEVYNTLKEIVVEN